MSRPIGRGWATVELERAAGELADLLRRGAAFEPAARSVVLGAQCRRGIPADGSHSILILEPDTEGRLALFLARHGEGWAATWLGEDGAAPQVGAARGSGPLGPESLEPGGPPAGPFRLRVSPATIEP
ncbi:MAG TPA: hypothetical protein VGQ89_01960 [Candidatus Limnocylindrales bacterium]|nr:hypothetical protein [Candidatus Limnocylindrales bacterium]